MKNSVRRSLWLSATASVLVLTACTTAGPTPPPAMADTPPVAEAAEMVEAVEVASTATAFPDYVSATVTPAFTAEGIAALEARMKQFVTDGDTAGIATLLVNDGQIVSHTQAGISKIATGDPIAEDTIYRIYSMTKPITGVAMMTLYEEGKFSLDDPVSKFIPEFENLQVVKSYEADGTFEVEPLDRQPTMRELMSHTAGFGYGLWGDDPANKAFVEKQIMRSPDLETFIDAVADVPLMDQPGTRWFYSSAVDIQGAIIERISGQTLGEFFDERIFTPLKMTDTGFYVPEEDYGRFSDVFGYHPETKEMGPVPFPTVAFRKETIAMESGGGGLVATLGDYARFTQMLAEGGALDDVRILKPETVTLMRTNVLPEGVEVDTDGRLARGSDVKIHFGLDFGLYANTASTGSKIGEGTYFWGGAAGTWFWIDPVNDVVFIGMIQRFAQNAPTPVDFGEVSRNHVYGAMSTEE